MEDFIPFFSRILFRRKKRVVARNACFRDPDVQSGWGFAYPPQIPDYFFFVSRDESSVGADFESKIENLFSKCFACFQKCWKIPLSLIPEKGGLWYFQQFSLRRLNSGRNSTHFGVWTGPGDLVEPSWASLSPNGGPMV